MISDLRIIFEHFIIINPSERFCKELYGIFVLSRPHRRKVTRKIHKKLNAFGFSFLDNYKKVTHNFFKNAIFIGNTCRLHMAKVSYL